MMIKKKWLIAALVVVLLSVVSYFSFQIALADAVDLVEVPFATSDLYSHYEIKEEDLEWREIPKAYVDEEVLLKKEDIIGKYVSLDSKVAKGSVFYKAYLIPKEKVEMLPALLLKEDQVAFPLKTDLIKSSGNTILKNQKVDIYVTYTDKKTKAVTTDLLIRNVRVIGLKDKSGYEMSNEKAAKIPSVMVLAINQTDILYLQMANELAEISVLASRVDYASDEEAIFNEESKVLPYLKL